MQRRTRSFLHFIRRFFYCGLSGEMLKMNWNGCRLVVSFVFKVSSLLYICKKCFIRFFVLKTGFCCFFGKTVIAVVFSGFREVKSVLKLKKQLRSQEGFTLAELIVVLVILAILAAFTIPAMLGFVEEAKGKAAIAEAREVYVAAQRTITGTANSEITDFSIQKKMVDLLKNDSLFFTGENAYDPEYQIMIENVRNDGSAYDLRDDYHIRKTIKMVVLLGKKGTDQENVIQRIQYINNGREYLATITPGGSAEITKIEKN